MNSARSEFHLHWPSEAARASHFARRFFMEEEILHYVYRVPNANTLNSLWVSTRNRIVHLDPLVFWILLIWCSCFGYWLILMGMGQQNRFPILKQPQILKLVGSCQWIYCHHWLGICWNFTPGFRWENDGASQSLVHISWPKKGESEMHAKSLPTGIDHGPGFFGWPSCAPISPSWVSGVKDM